ncbi:MAG: glycosyltransferase family 61 protein [Alphaproteobacteria bacterium]
MVVLGNRTWLLADYCADNEGAVAKKIWQAPDGKYFFRVYDIRNGVSVGSPAVLGVIREGLFHWFLESNDHLSFDSQFERLAASTSGRELRTIPMPGQWCVLNGSWSGNFYHWMTECLTKVYFLENAHYPGKYLVPRRKFVDESLALMGVSPDRIHIAEDHHGDFGYYYQFDSLLVCDRFNAVVDIVRADALARTFRDHIFGRLGLVGRSSRKIYIARDHYRLVTNEAELATVLEKHGFERVYMETMPLSEQIALIAQARILLGPNGAGLTHALFQPDGATLIELVSPYYSNPCFMSIANAFHNKYYMISSVAREQTYDIVVPTEAVDALLALIAHGEG